MPPKKKEEVELNISIEQFTRTRDSVIVSLSNLQRGLTHVQNGLNDMMTAYIKHTASVLAGEDGALELPDNIQESMASAANNIALDLAAITAPDADLGKDKKRKREKKIKDPNAPKRPETAYFLYAKSARPIVRRDLENELEAGAKLEPGAVQMEVTKRWNELPQEEKDSWKDMYQETYEQYKKDVIAYKATLDGAVEDVEAVEDEVSEGEPKVADSDDDDSSDDETPAKAPTPPPATNGKTPARKRQKTAATPQANGAAPAAAPTPVPLPSGRNQVQPASASAVEATPVKKDTKKKRAEKAEKVAEKEPSPEESRKKTKSSRSTRNAEPEGEEKEKPKKRERSKRKSEGGA